MTQTEYESFLSVFIPSDEMREYLSAQMLPDGAVTDVIQNAAVPLDVKAKWLHGKDKDEAERAMTELRTVRTGEHFTLEAAWYDGVYRSAMYSFMRPVASWEAAEEEMRRDVGEAREFVLGEASPFDHCWYVLRKWRQEDGKYCLIYKYDVVNGQPVYAETGCRSAYPSLSANVDLPVPFSVGDILTVDCRPFAPPIRAVLIEKGDNKDCCCLQILYRDPCTQSWIIHALKHGLRFYDRAGSHYWPTLSPLYRLKRFDGLLENEDRFLRRVSRALKGSDARGRMLYDLACGHGKSVKDPPEDIVRLADTIRRSRRDPV